MKQFDFVKKTVTVSLALALLLEAPGLRAYAAMGELLNPGGGEISREINPAISLPNASGVDYANLQVMGLSLSPENQALETYNQVQGRARVQAKISQNPADQARADNLTKQYHVALKASALANLAAAPKAQENSSNGFIKGRLFPALRKTFSSSSIKGMAAGARKIQGAISRLFDGEDSGRGVLPGSDGVSSITIGGQNHNRGLSASGAFQLSPADSRDHSNAVSSSVGVPTPASVPPGPSGPSGQKGFPISGSVKTTLRVAFAVVAVQALAVHLLPAVFGLMPVAAVWAVASGVLALPAALYTRYRLSLRDSPRLNKVKWILDSAIGGLIGASVVAFPFLATALATPILPALAALASISGLGVFFTMAGGGSGMNFLLGGASLVGLSHLIGVGALGALGLGPILGMATIPVIATISFFLRFLINAAETGTPFGIPGALMGTKMRFPTFPWVMTGVVFALLSGFVPWHESIAFFAWNLFGDPKVQWDKTKPWFKNLPAVLLNFNVLYVGLFVFAAATGFASPATFLVLAFLPERMAHWTEALLQKILPASAPQPSSQSPANSTPQTIGEKIAVQLPAVNRWLRTATYLTLMVGAAAALGFGVFGIHQLLKVSIAAIVLSVIPFLFSAPIIKKLQKATDTDRTQDPAIYRVVDDLRSLENANRPGKKPIPVPEVVILPTELPNAFATGPSPFHAMVGVTQGTKDMLLTPENLRQNLLNAIAASDPNGDAFNVLRRTIAESVSGASETDSPEALSQVVKTASAADLERLGERYLRGVLAHEFTHVMDRHMLSGFIMGSVLNAVSFAAYGLLWTVVVGHRLVSSVRRALGFSKPQDEDTPDGQTFAPLGVPALMALPGLVRVFLALWATLFLQMVQVAASRNNEAQADEGGSRLVKDPQALAAALVLLTNWRPTKGFSLSEEESLKLILNSRFFTVSPIEQLDQNGLLAKMKNQDGPPISRGDDWLFYALIMNHPETPARIKELWQMSEQLKAQNVPPAPLAAR